MTLYRRDAFFLTGAVMQYSRIRQHPSSRIVKGHLK